MQVRVKLMGVLRSKLPTGSQGGTATVDLEAGATVTSLLDQLGISAGFVHLIMVNGAMELDRHRVLLDGDEVMAFPPVAGGSDEAPVSNRYLSPLWVWLMVSCFHIGLWLSLVGGLVFLLPRFKRTLDEFGMKVPWGTETMLTLANRFSTFPPLGVILPICDLLILSLLHRVAQSRLPRVCWTLFILLLTQLLLLASLLGVWVAYMKLLEGLYR